MKTQPKNQDIQHNHPDEASAKAAWERQAAKMIEPRPAKIIFFPNNTAGVYDQNGKQMRRFHQGDHQAAIDALAKDGVDWKTLEVKGEPKEKPT